MAVANPPLDNRDIAEFTVRGVEAADVPESVYDGFLALLARGFSGLGDPCRARLIGPVVPGATMVHGARVPGTSYELDPVAAAFCIGVAACWRDDAGAPPGRWESYGALLAVTDYRARRAHHLALDPPCVRELLAALSVARRIEDALARESGSESNLDDGFAVRVACAAVTTRLLGGGVAEIAAAASLALGAGAATVHPRARGVAGCARWVGADAASRGLRLALLALAAADEGVGASAGTMLHAARFGEPAAPDPPPVPGASLERLAASVRGHFEARQAALILGRVADQAALLATPVHEFVATLVRNA